ncbi:MAG: alpha/beta hydrolase [Proteobacteria bacterium]|nr:alpha/beta hydrolase [Pseudomonadota bacterium]
MPYLKVNDINLYYERHGQGEPVLFIHGLGSSTRDWEYQLDYFKARYQMLLIDLRGHGKSDKPDHPYTIAQFTSDTAKLIQAFFPQGVHVVGHSLGGMVAFQLGVDYPELVKTLTIVNSAPAVIFPSFKAQIYFLLRAFDVRLFGMHHLSTQLAKALLPKPEQAALRETFVQRWCENDPKAYRNALRAFRGWTVMHRIPSILCPTLVIAAENDYTEVSFKQLYVRLMPNAKLVVIKDSRHLTIIDQAELFNQTVGEFLKENPLPIR